MFVTQGLLATALLITVAILAACGQKGPLYMPDEKQDEQIQHNEQDQSKN
ncbi:MAG: lipoprotein [Gammaproteobacteria bacterium]|nr:lipoprotein [Gammaproteobacteria bacterium]